MKSKYVVVLLAVLLAATPLRATTRATDYPGSVSILLGHEEAQTDLALTPKQKSRLNALRTELRSKSRVLVKKGATAPDACLTADQKLSALIDSNNACALAVLTPEQSASFHEIQNQALGYTMLVSPKVQKKLALSAKQVISIEKIRIKGIHLLRAYRNDQAEDYKAVLTPAQRKAFSVLGGVPLISAFWPPRGHFLLNPPRLSA
jgi:hypothetical protein